MSQPNFQKRQREKQRQERAAAKREKRATRPDGTEEEEPTASVPVPPESGVLEKLAALHEEYDKGDMDFDEFEDRKTDLISQLSV